jgi:hypothetical protein
MTKNTIGQDNPTEPFCNRGAGDPYNYKPHDRAARVAISPQKFSRIQIQTPRLNVSRPERNK